MTKAKMYTLKNGLQVEVNEVKRQKDILDVLNAQLKDSEYESIRCISKGHAFKILYKDGTTYAINNYFEIGTYRKRSIVGILYVTIGEYRVYGDYTVDEFGNVDIIPIKAE